MHQKSTARYSMQRPMSNVGSCRGNFNIQCWLKGSPSWQLAIEGFAPKQAYQAKRVNLIFGEAKYNLIDRN